MSIIRAQRLATALAELASCKNLQEKVSRADCLIEIRKYFDHYISNVARYQSTVIPELYALADIINLYFRTDGNDFFSHEMSPQKDVDTINVELSGFSGVCLRMISLSLMGTKLPDGAGRLEKIEYSRERGILELLYSKKAPLSLKDMGLGCFPVQQDLDALWDSVLFLRRLGVIHWTVEDGEEALCALGHLGNLRYQLTTTGKQICKDIFPQGKAKRHSPAPVISIEERRAALKKAHAQS